MSEKDFYTVNDSSCSSCSTPWLYARGASNTTTSNAAASNATASNATASNTTTRRTTTREGVQGLYNSDSYSP